MFGKRAPEVLIVGAGPVGLFAALSLVKRDVRVRLIDRAERSATHSYALVLHGDSLALFAELGLLDDVLGYAYRVERVGLYDGSGKRAEVDLTKLPGPYPFLAVTRQDVLENLLERKLREAGVKVDWNHRAARFVSGPDHTVVTVEKLVSESMGYAVQHTEWLVGKSSEVEVPFVVAADGFGSLVRRQHEIDFPEIGEAQQFAVFEFDTDFDADHEMRVVFDETSTNVLWPLPERRCRWSFQIEATRLPDEVRQKDRAFTDLGSMRFPVLDASWLDRLLAERAPWFTGKVERIHWRMAVRFERRLAERFGEGRVWLAGDSAHMAGPVAAQSMNVGLREAHELAKIIEHIKHRGGSIEDFAAYDRQRRTEWRSLLGLDGQLVVPDSGAARGDNAAWLAGVANGLLACIPASGETLRTLVEQLGLEWSRD